MKTFLLLFALGLQAPAVQPEAPKLEFVQIQPGDFMMGCADNDPQCDDDEKPAHIVHITRPFELGKYEVTQAQWMAVMGNNPSRFKTDSNLPVERVSHNDAVEFVKKLNDRKDGYAYRLPTEAEWEYAAHAGTKGQYAGPSLEALGWFDGNAERKTHPVGQKAPNPWGLYDIHGNVYEHVSDWWSSKTHTAGEVSDPQGPAEGEPIEGPMGGGRKIVVKLAKGGSYNGSQWSQRISNRGVGPVSDRADNMGVRIVRVKNP